MAHHGSPIPDHDHLEVHDLLQRMRTLTEPQLEAALEHERAHAARPLVVEAFLRRLNDLRHGGEPSGGAPDGDQLAAPPPAGGSQVDPSTSGPPVNPPSQGVPSNPAQPR